MVASDTTFDQVSLRRLALMHVANLKFHLIKIYQMQKFVDLANLSTTKFTCYTVRDQIMVIHSVSAYFSCLYKLHQPRN